MHAPRHRTARHALAVVTTAALLGVPVAAVAEDTTVSFEVAATGALSISQAGATATLTAGGGALTFSPGSTGTVTGTLPETTVTDQRGTPLGGWTVRVSATGPFASGDRTVALSNARVFLDAANLTELTGTLLSGAVSGMTISSAEYNVGANNLSSGYDLLTGTTTLGNGSVVYTPTVSVDVPAGTPAGTYGTTVQQTVS